MLFLFFKVYLKRNYNTIKQLDLIETYNDKMNTDILSSGMTD